MFLKERQQGSQVLKNPEIQNPAGELSLLLRDSKRQTAQSTKHFSSKQHTGNVTTADKENQPLNNNISSKFQNDIGFLQDEEIQKAKQKDRNS